MRIDKSFIFRAFLLIALGLRTEVSRAQTSPCDVNHDGVVNSTDVQLEVNAVLGLTSCTADLDGDGRCDVIDVQRIVVAALGGTCRVDTPGGATPTLVQQVNQSLLASGFNVSSNGTFSLNLPNGTQQGNAIVLALTTKGSFGGSVSDDQSNAWTAGPSAQDTANNQFAYIYYALNVKQNTRTITIHSGSGGLTVFQPTAAEFYNVALSAAADGSSGASGNSATVTAGNLTPTTSGDLLFHYVFRSTNQVNSGFTAGSQSSINWRLLSQDTLDGDAVQYGVYNSTATINPQMTMSSGTSFVSVAIALKSATAGAAPPGGIRVVKILHETFVKSSPTTQTLGVPCTTGDLVVAMISGNSAWLVNSMSDSNSNTWHNTGPQLNNNSCCSEGAQTWYISNANCSTNMTVTVTFNSTSTGHGGIFFYDITGASASPFNVDATANGYQNDPAGSPLPNAPTITPTVPNTLLLCEMPVQYNTVGGMTNVPGTLFDSSNYTGESVSGPEPVDQNNGWGHANVSGTGPFSITWTQFYAGSSNPAFRGWVARCNAWH
jgi:hypothetical protein